MQQGVFGPLKKVGQWLMPPSPEHASHTEHWVSAVGGFLGIIGVLWFSNTVLDHHGASLIVASMGASAVLLFAVPHGNLSQPWAVIGGHLVSALIGVTCARLVHDPFAAGALAVGLAIGAMYYLHCIHPPGGATALVAVLGDDAVHQLGYSFVLTPVLENVLIILAVAVVVNLPFRWRRYPIAFAQLPQSEPVRRPAMPSHQDLVYAVSQLDSFIDVSEEDLNHILALALQHMHERPQEESSRFVEATKNGRS